jgi:hypothetical protein
MISDINSAMGRTRSVEMVADLDRSILKHRIFAQFMKSDDDGSEVQNSDKTAKTAATATFARDEEEDTGLQGNFALDSSKANSQLLPSKK